MTYSQVVQATSDRHNEIADPVLPIPHFLLHDPAALDTGHRVLDPHFLARDTLVLGFLRVCEDATLWFLGWLLDVSAGNGKALEAHVLIQHAADW